jgi:hypothetical protein
MRYPKKGVAIAIGLLVALVAGLIVAGTSSARAPRRHIALILDYQVTQSCPVFPNYPKPGVKGNNIGWTIAPGQIVSWRYNVNGHWAMISDAKYARSAHPWWGFTPRKCIGGSVGGEHFPTRTSHYPTGLHIPTTILQGRSAVQGDHYRSVMFQVPASHIVGSRTVRSMGTLRDARGRFVIGNVFPGWHVRVTNVRAGTWTKVYVPNAQRWGWVENPHLTP